MSNISSNALFHFTSKAEYLIGILTDNFMPRYCFEEVLLTEDNEGKKLCCAIPMVCFCDISLGQINNHIKTYGSYGIGMTKQWGIKNQLNPLIYINQGSTLAESFNKMAKHISEDEFDNIFIDDEFATLSKFLKPYTGDFERNGKIIKNVKFYNEREWRFIPDLDNDKKVSKFMVPNDYNNSVKLAQENKKLQKFKLEFTPDDIKYIFVKDESEIHPMIEALREIKGGKFDGKTIDLLTSKILTTKQLEEDF
jgi:hypothetical protein